MGTKILTNLRFEDDVLHVASSLKDLKFMLAEVSDACVASRLELLWQNQDLEQYKAEEGRRAK
eukprot:6928647-Karenia_brevis.AAC.1